MARSFDFQRYNNPDAPSKYYVDYNNKRYNFNDVAEFDAKLRAANVGRLDATEIDATISFTARNSDFANSPEFESLEASYNAAQINKLEARRAAPPVDADIETSGNLDLVTRTEAARAQDSGTTSPPSSQSANVDAVKANPADVEAFKGQSLDDQIKMTDNAIEDTNKIDKKGESYKQTQKDNPDKLPEKPENMTTAQRIAFGLFMLTMGLGYYNKKQKEKREKCEKQCKPAGQSLSMWAAESVTKDDLSNPSGNDFLTDCYETTCWNSSATLTDEDLTGGTYCSATNVDTHTECTTKCKEACKALYPDLTMEDIIKEPSRITQDVIPAAVTGLAEDAAQAAADAANAAIDAAGDVGGNLFGGAFKVIMIIVGVIVGLVVLGLLGYAASKSGGSKKTA